MKPVPFTFALLFALWFIWAQSVIAHAVQRQADAVSTNAVVRSTRTHGEYTRSLEERFDRNNDRVAEWLPKHEALFTILVSNLGG